jgi:diguanylate cyclase (GGDEF)-like protein
MRRLSLVALLIGIALVPLAYGVAVKEHDRGIAETRRKLAEEAEVHARQLEAYFERARAVILLTANQPAFRHFDEQPGTRLEKLRAHGRELDDATAALAYLERLYPTSIGEACFIDWTGAEAARVVRGEVAPIDDLSTEEEAAPFFAPALAVGEGNVYQAAPYVSPDTKEWVIANATPTPSADGRVRSIVHFEVTIESFRRALGADDGKIELRVVDARTGRVVIDGLRPQRVGATLGVSGDRRFVALTQRPAASGIVSVADRPTAYRRVQREAGNANEWVLAATSASPQPSLFQDLGPAPLGMLAGALFLIVIGAIGLRAQKRELEDAAETDVLTGLGNRRALLSDLERRLSRSSGEPAVLMIFDLNGFKGYNDTFGHPAGDALLTRLGQALTAAVAPHARAYRLGGDEFCVLGRATADDQLEAAAATALSEHGDGFSITAASGVVVIPDEARDASEAMRVADQRMYARKLSSRPGPDRQSKDVLVRVLAERYPELGDHLEGVADLAEAVAAKLGLGEQETAAVRHAAALHDIGKVAIPDSILSKPAALDEDEWAFMRTHTLIGERILGGAPALAPLGRLVRSSHEHMDGAGYPDGLTGEEIPLGARIIAVCDAYDAMLSPRPYSPARTRVEALAELRRCAGSQFDPAVVEAFAAVAADDAGEQRAAA